MWIVDVTVSFFFWIGRAIIYLFQRLGQLLGIVRSAETQRAEQRQPPNEALLQQFQVPADQASEQRQLQAEEEAKEEVEQLQLLFLEAILAHGAFRAEEEEKEEQEQEQKRKREEFERKQAYAGEAVVEINSVIDYAIGLLEQDISKEEALFHLYVALSYLIELGLPLSIREGVQDIINESAPKIHSDGLARAYQHITQEIFIKTNWRRGAELNDVSFFLTQMLENLLNLLAQQAGDGYLAGLYYKSMEEEKNAEDNTVAGKVIEEILLNNNINQPLLGAIDLLYKPDREQRNKEGEESEQEEPSWAGRRVKAKPSSKPLLTEANAKNKEERDAKVRQARWAAFERQFKAKASASQHAPSSNVDNNGLHNVKNG
ncbi:MAG: hypothetical protein K0R24_1055 [Gammaproteobacteria bacterium]|jgi:hypothetical protein|nr:hypothetical protein [Gammaproteobacteria bacterium]